MVCVRESNYWEEHIHGIKESRGFTALYLIHDNNITALISTTEYIHSTSSIYRSA